MAETALVDRKRVGIAYWMQEVLDQCDRVAADFGADPVHDLRTALRRCRSMADGIMVVDSDNRWKKMKKAGRELFRNLGDLRDTHVMLEWVQKLAPANDPVGKALGEHLTSREQTLKNTALAALHQFDRRQWKSWAAALPERAARIPIDSPVFAHLAVERWGEAYELHHRALRNRSGRAFHQLRIGLKRFRYTVENFLPRLEEIWGQDLKQLQRLLGDVHDFDVLWQMTTSIKPFPNAASRSWWRARLRQERQERLKEYRQKMTGRNSAWVIWRAALPPPEELRSIALERLQIWASFLDPAIEHAEHVARLALELYDGLPAEGILRQPKQKNYRDILEAAALMHDVGLAKTSKGHHKASARMIRKLSPPLGWAGDEMSLAAAVARYHRGALPREKQPRFRALAQGKRHAVKILGGILRFACACDRQHNSRIQRLEVDSTAPVLRIRAEGYSEYTSLSERLAAARHLLELACNCPVVILPWGAENQARAA
ncbi:MAG: CHAD domain-containing protein [Acidobacteria bacterium]|nr:CHAD domain-containing protein [Acidobacteriota bacterium]